MYSIETDLTRWPSNVGAHEGAWRDPGPLLSSHNLMPFRHSVGELEKLKMARIGINAQSRDYWMTHLGCFKSVECLSIGGTVPDWVIDSLGTLGSLRKLQIHDHGGASLAAIGSLSRLTHFSLIYRKADIDLEPVFSLPQLQALELGMPLKSTRFPTTIMPVSNLKYLAVGGCSSSAVARLDSLEGIQMFRGLEILTLSRIQCRDRSLELLSQLDRLTTVYLSELERWNIQRG